MSRAGSSFAPRFTNIRGGGDAGDGRRVEDLGHATLVHAHPAHHNAVRQYWNPAQRRLMVFVSLPNKC